MKKSNENKSEKVNHHGENSQGVTNCGLKLESKLCEFSFARSVVRFVQGNYRTKGPQIWFARVQGS